jgi:hypothetical protein
MEKLYYNLSEEEFSKGKKILLWSFTSLFFLAGLGILVMILLFHDTTVSASVSLAPFGISLVSGSIAAMATFRGKDHFFIIDDDKIEYTAGFFKPKTESYLWRDIKEIHLPHKQKKVKLFMKNDTSSLINLTWIEKKKSSHIRKHIYYAAKEKNINISKPQVLGAK